MDLYAVPKSIENRTPYFKLFALLSIYSSITAYVYSLDAGIGLKLIAYIVTSMIIGGLLLFRDYKFKFSDGVRSSGNCAIPSLGKNVLSFDFQFNATENPNITDELLRGLSKDLNELSAFCELIKTKTIDNSLDLIYDHQRPLYVSSGQLSHTGSRATLLVYLLRSKDAIYVNWFVMVMGYVTKKKIVRFIALCPLLLPFLLSGVVKGKRIISWVQDLRNSDQEKMDSLNSIKHLHFVCVDSLASTLESNGIDASYLRNQREQGIHISMSGKNISIGNVVSGAKNIVKSNQKAA